MDLTYVCIIIITVVVTATVTFLLARKEHSTHDIAFRDDGQVKFLAEKEEIVKGFEVKLAEAEKTHAERERALKDKYDELMAEANERIKDLDTQLSLTVEGNVDEVIKQRLASVDSLQKKINSLKEDLEEAEEDAEVYKKKLRSKDADILAMQDEISKLNKDKSDMSQELAIMADTLSEKTKELEVKMMSIAFVQEVLTAPKTKDASLDKLYDKVDAVANYVVNDFYDCVTSIYNKDETWDYYFDSGIKHWDTVARKIWIQGKTTIAFVGEFSAGKTSIVNRVLSQDQPDVALLPVSAKATTAIPTYITGGPGVSYNFVSADNTLKTIKESTFKEVSKEVLGQINGISSLIKYFVMQYKNPNLNSISILDTPGFNSNDEEDANRTIDVINECDALFWVFDVNSGSANRTSLKLIKENLRKPLYVVINKIDSKPRSEVDKVEDLVKQQFDTEGIQVERYIRFSAKEPLSVIMDAIKSVPISINDDYLHNLIEDFLSKLHKSLGNEINEANAEYQEKEKNAESINEKYYQLAKDTQNKCLEAQDIPQFTEHFRVFGIGKDDNYEMTIDEASRLKEMLDEIANQDMNELWRVFHEYYEAAQEVQNSWEYLSNAKVRMQRVMDSENQLKKRIKEYEKMTKLH